MTPVADELFPRWAHVPGVTKAADRERLDEARGAFRQRPDQKLLYGFDLLRRSFAWEAHEILEDLWMQAHPNTRDREALKILIQIANAGLKNAMGRSKAAARLWQQAETALRDLLATGPTQCLGLDFAEVAAFVRSHHGGAPNDTAIKFMFLRQSVWTTRRMMNYIANTDGNQTES